MMRRTVIRPFTTSTFARWRVLLIGCALAALSGCRAAPPRYQTTWERATSPCYLPVVPYCHGFSPTTWSRWPEGCEAHDYVLVEEIAQPVPQRQSAAPAADPNRPMPEDAEIFEVPPAPESPATPELDAPVPPATPQSSQRRPAPSRERASNSTKRRPRQARHAGEPMSWTAHLQRFADEVTHIR